MTSFQRVIIVSRLGVALGASVGILGLLFMPPGWNREAFLPVLTLGLLILGRFVAVGERGTRPAMPPRAMIWAAGLWVLVLTLSTASGQPTALGAGTQACWMVILWLGWWIGGDRRILSMPVKAASMGALVVSVVALSQLWHFEFWPRRELFGSDSECVLQSEPSWQLLRSGTALGDGRLPSLPTEMAMPPVRLPFAGGESRCLGGNRLQSGPADTRRWMARVTASTRASLATRGDPAVDVGHHDGRTAGDTGAGVIRG